MTTLVTEGREDLGDRREDLGDRREDLGDWREDLGDRREGLLAGIRLGEALSCPQGLGLNRPIGPFKPSGMYVSGMSVEEEMC